MSEPYHLHSLPVVSNATSLTPSVCNFSRVSAPAVSSASATGTPFQTLMGSAYLYQHSSTTMLSGVTDHSQISTSAASYPVMETSLVMKNSLGLQPPSQTFCVTQTQELPKSCSSRNSHILESNPPSELGDISVTAPVQSARRLLALPPAPSQGQIESKNVDDIKTKLSKPLDAYQIPIENQDPPLLPSGIPDIRQPLACTDPLSQEEQPGSENADLGENSRSRQDLGTLENGTEPSSGLADITTLAEGIHLPQLFNPLKDLDQSQVINLSNSEMLLTGA
uniref:Chromosome 2 open reading frame 78 n=1 Tax=Balaenoptera musculus TaxID=9771 RepID=A0A8C0D608_BALMU